MRIPLKERQDVMLATSTVYVPVGQRTEITLNDGTKVWLNSNTSLCIGRQDGKTRYVSIDGEAYFDVAHNADIPFVVKAGDREVRVLGTKFSVLSYLDGNDFSVTVHVTISGTELRPSRSSLLNNSALQSSHTATPTPENCMPVLPKSMTAAKRARTS